MDVKSEIEVVQQSIRHYVKVLVWLRRNQVSLAALPRGAMCDRQIDFDGLNHHDAIRVIRALGGKWKKKNSYSSPDKIDYVTELDGGIRIRIWAGEPPPSCRIVEVEESRPEIVIPACVVKVKKMICGPGVAV